MNTITLSPPMLAVLFVCAAAGVELLRLMVGFVFRRFVSPGFVKISDCERCGENSAVTDDGLKKDIRAIKRVLFSIATNGEANADDLRHLVT